MKDILEIQKKCAFIKMFAYCSFRKQDLDPQSLTADVKTATGDDDISIAFSETTQFDHRKEIKYGKPIRVKQFINKILIVFTLKIVKPVGHARIICRLFNKQYHTWYAIFWRT